jgi:hypothetical protein
MDDQFGCRLGEDGLQGIVVADVRLEQPESGALVRAQAMTAVPQGVDDDDVVIADEALCEGAAQIASAARN